MSLKKIAEYFQVSLFALTLLLLLSYFYWPALSGQASLYTNDIALFFEPLCTYVGQSLRHGRFPLWNELSYTGMPQIALPFPCLLYPPTWLFAAFNFSCALSLNLVGHQVLAGVGFYLLVRGFAGRKIAALACGIAYALSGYFFAMQTNYNNVCSAAWIPLVIFSLYRISSRPFSAAKFFAAVLIFALFALSGAPELIVLGSFFSASFLLASTVYDASRRLAAGGAQGRLRSDLLSLFYRLLAILLGLLIAAPLILPTYEWLALSPRGTGLDFEQVFHWSANWYDFLSVICSQPLGDISILEGRALALLVPSRVGFLPYLSSPYLGPVLFTFAIWGAFSARWKLRWAALILLVGGSLFAAGSNSFFMPWLFAVLPKLAVFRYPVKFMIIPLFGLCLLAAGGVQSGLRQAVSLKQIVASCAFWLAICGLGAYFYFDQDLKFTAQHVSDTTNIARSMLGRECFVTALIGLLICLLQFVYQRDSLRRAFYCACILVAMTGTLMTSALAFQRHFAPANFYEKQTAINLEIRRFASDFDPKYQRVLSVEYNGMNPPGAYYFDKVKQMPPSAVMIEFNRDLLEPNTHMDAGLTAPYGYEGALVGTYKSYFHKLNRVCAKVRKENKPPFDVPLARFCYLTATRFIFAQAENIDSAGHLSKSLPLLDSEYWQLLKTDPYLNFRLYAVKGSLPRAYFARTWRVENDEEKVLNEMAESFDKRLDPRHETILQTVPQSKQSSANLQLDVSQSQDRSSSSGKIAFVRDKDEELVLSTDSAKAELMVLSDTYYPGWKAYIDGASVAIYKANVFNRAIFVPVGQHTISFKYQPTSFYLGLAASLLSLLATLLVCVRHKRR